MPQRRADAARKACELLIEAIAIPDEAGVGQRSTPHIAMAFDTFDPERLALQVLANTPG